MNWGTVGIQGVMAFTMGDRTEAEGFTIAIAPLLAQGKNPLIALPSN